MSSVNDKFLKDPRYKLISNVFFTVGNKEQKKIRDNEFVTESDFRRLLDIVDNIKSAEDDVYTEVEKIKKKRKRKSNNEVGSEPDWDAINSRFKKVFDKSFNIIIDVLNNIKTNNNGKVTYPLIIRQIIFYFTFKAYEDQIDDYYQDKVRELLMQNGYKLKENFWGTWGILPKRYYETMNYIQPQSLAGYKGEKKGALGFAINELVRQAGSYSAYVDIFGGSGSASTAVYHINRCQYFYNEKNRAVRNLMEVLLDDALYSELICQLKLLQESIEYGAEISLFDDSSSDYWIDFLSEKEKYYRSANIKWERKDNHNTIIANSEDSEIAFDNIPLIMNDLYVRIIVFQNNYIFKTREGEKTKEEIVKIFHNCNMEIVSFVIEKKIDNIDKNKEYQIGNKLYSGKDIIDIYDKSISPIVLSYFQNARLVYSCLEILSILNSKEYVVRNSEKLTYGRVQDEYMQYRALMYWIKFTNMLNTKKDLETRDDKLAYALAFIFLQSVAMNGIDIKSDSQITHMLNDDSQDNTSYKAVSDFCGSDFKIIVENLRSVLKGTVVLNYDAEELVSNYKTVIKSSTKADIKGIIFYSDSPYEGTSDYKDEANGVDAFTSSNMRGLINALIRSEQRFIFSCRATLTKNQEKKQDPMELIENVFKPFSEELSQYIISDNYPLKSNKAHKVYYRTEKLYVLAIIDLPSDKAPQSVDEFSEILSKMIKNRKVVELMITNYYIHGFYYQYMGTSMGVGRKLHKVNYMVYEYDEFLDILKSSM